MSRIDWKQALAPGAYVLLLAIALIFAHSAIEGQRGIRALHEARAEIKALEVELAEAEEERAEIANLVRRLQPDFLDLDLLDERARDVLGMARTDELLIRP
ncbi:MAG: septum formation initiator family protein [Pseudomonadota bacterium]